MAARDVVSSLQREVELAKEGLKNVDQNIKKLTGRDPSEARGPVGNRRIVVNRNFGERIGGPPQKRFNAGNAYNRLGPRVGDRNNRRFGQLESDGEEEEDDGKKPTLQSSIVATPVPSREQQEAKTDKKTQTRNKRMFGVLLGTLQKFKENSSKEAARERKRKQIDKKLEEAAIQEREQAIRKKKELFVARREKQTEVEELERKIEIAEMLEEWEDHDRKLSKYIRTNTKPHIFYIPAKHNDYTRGLLEKTEEHVEDAIKKRRHEISEILYKPADDARDEDEREPGNDSMVHGDDREPDVKQGVDHSDDEGNSKSRREVVFKGGRRKVILTSKRRRSESKDDEIGETNEERNSRKVGKVGKVKDDEGTVEGNEGNEMEMKSEEVGEEKVDRKVETEEKQEEREGGLEMSEVNERKVKDEEKEVEGKEMEETKVETQEMPEEQRTQEEVTGGIGVNRESEGEPTKDGDNSAVTAEEVEDAPAGSEKVVKSMDLVEQTADVQETKNQPKEGGEENETESKMQVDPGQDNDE